MRISILGNDMLRKRDVFWQLTQLINVVLAELTEYEIILPLHTAMAARLQNTANQNSAMLQKSSPR